MTAKTNLSDRVDVHLAVLAAEVADLPNVEAEWEQFGDGQRASWSLDWDHLMASSLTEVDEAQRAGRLSADQRARYAALLRELQRALPIVERLNLYRPPVSLDRVIIASTASSRVATE